MTDLPYVKRPADDILLNKLEEREYCYILSPPQTGKTRLLKQTVQNLREKCVICAGIDLKEVQDDLIRQDTEENWYAGIISFLVKELDFSNTYNYKKFHKQRADVLVGQRLSVFIEQVLLREVRNNIVILFDNIDSILTLKFCTEKFKNNFFAIIRECYRKKNQNNQPNSYDRLTFALFGAAAPLDLVQDEDCTPFGISWGIELGSTE